jgi:hypothetical protein
MICPNCCASLPIRFALCSLGAVYTCPACGTGITPTPASLKKVGLLIYLPTAAASGVLIPIGIHYAKRFNNWSIPLAGLLALILVITVWSIAISRRICEFQKA